MEKGKLTLKNQELIFKPVKKDAAKDIKEKAPRATAPSVDMRQVEIHGDIAKIGKDRLLMYLESETRSGGGKLISKNLQANPPTVTFFDEKGNELMNYQDLFSNVLLELFPAKAS